MAGEPCTIAPARVGSGPEGDEHVRQARRSEVTDRGTAQSADVRRPATEGSGEIKAHPGRTLIYEGDASQEAFIVADGNAEIRIGDEVVRQTDVGEMIGDIGVLEKRPRTATVTAVTDMRLLVLNGRDLDWLFQDKRLAARVQENLERHLAGPQPS